MKEASRKMNDPIEVVKPSQALIDRFMSKIDFEGPLPDQTNPHYCGLGK
jgi:hypothetical protein